MGFFRANIWKSSGLRSIASLFKTQERTIKCVYVSEAGVVSLEGLALSTGYCVLEADKAAWAVINRLKMRMAGCDEPVLPISERSHLPLDPLGRLTTEEITSLRPLEEIASAKYSEAFSRTLENNRKSNGDVLKTLALALLVATTIIVIIVLWRSKGGG